MADPPAFSPSPSPSNKGPIATTCSTLAKKKKKNQIKTKQPKINEFSKKNKNGDVHDHQKFHLGLRKRKKRRENEEEWAMQMLVSKTWLPTKLEPCRHLVMGSCPSKGFSTAKDCCRNPCKLLCFPTRKFSHFPIFHTRIGQCISQCIPFSINVDPCS